MVQYRKSIETISEDWKPQCNVFSLTRIPLLQNLTLHVHIQHKWLRMNVWLFSTIRCSIPHPTQIQPPTYTIIAQRSFIWDGVLCILTCIRCSDWCMICRFLYFEVNFLKAALISQVYLESFKSYVQHIVNQKSKSLEFDSIIHDVERTSIEF